MIRENFRVYSSVAILMAIFVFSSVSGCASGRPTSNESIESQSDAENHTNSDALAEDFSGVPAIVLPFELSLSGEEAGDNTRITVTVTYRHPIAVSPALELAVEPPNGIIGAGRLELPPDEAGAKVSKQFIVTGKNPRVRARIQYISDGFGVEMHESYPTTNAQKRAAERIADPRQPLPAPIDVDGQIITHGVEVTPQ